eukprot:2042058-Pyramimonas_sp.AAC.1
MAEADLGVAGSLTGHWHRLPTVWSSLQVCSYRCIVSHESPQFEAFSLCILQKHNCLNNNAERPPLPD